MKDKTCKGCEQQFTPQRSFQQCCSPRCAIDLSIKNRNKKRKSENRKYKKEFRDKDKTWHANALKRDFHRWVKWRDRNEDCISCGCSLTNLPSRSVHASHYRPAGGNSAVKYHPWNVHLACSVCNAHKSGNLVSYRAALIDKIGLENVEWLESQTQTCTWDIDDLKLMRVGYRRILRDVMTEN